MSEPSSNILGSRFTAAFLLRFAAPTMGMMVFMGLYSIVDTIFVSRLVGTLALSAVNICTPVLYTTVGLSGMLATGASAIIGRKMGAGDEAGARQTFSFILACGAGLSLLLLAAGLLWLEPLLRALGASDLVMPYCRDYLGIQLLFLPAVLLSTLCQNLFVTAGRPGLGFRLSLGSGVLNIFLDWLLMVPFDMGIAGASLGTGCSYLLPAVAGLVVFGRQRGTLYIVRPVARLRELIECCGNGRISAAVSFLRTFGFLLAGLVALPALLGVSGVWLAVPIAELGAFLTAVFFLARCRGRYGYL